ncbi:type II toxin-antitoxin system RelE/ParE family toxin [Fundidesulfovibrio butyratiphilus]
MEWEIFYYSDLLQEEILAMPVTLQARYLHLTARMRVFGADLGLPHTRAMGDGLFELRLKGAEGIARVFYCTLVGKKIVMLHHFIKKSDKTPKREILVAIKRMQEVKAC